MVDAQELLARASALNIEIVKLQRDMRILRDNADTPKHHKASYRYAANAAEHAQQDMEEAIVGLKEIA